ncbi:MAG: hypothetical protein FI725_02905 [SAR202 cluster bacterium]|nr:hypothetical protein [SAR202 cluster bacterium]|tara:strand:- start:5007 stop:5834 length:828 start_codon:yes stop_codon:yes gene_type:complete
MSISNENVDHVEPISEFRTAVSRWLDANATIPEKIDVPGRGRPMSQALKDWAVEFRLKLGAKGWIAPNWPREYGGGGLSNNHAAIINQELSKRRLPPLQVSIMHASPFRVYGTEDQKKTFLRSILRGEITVANTFTEVAHGSDLQSTEATAIKDGDEYVINAKKAYITSPLRPDLFLCLAATNPEAPPEYRYSVIIVDAHTPGIEIKAQSLLTPGREHTVFYTNAHAPRTQILGEEGQGLEIAGMMVEIERGGISVPLQKQLEIEESEANEKDPH